MIGVQKRKATCQQVTITTSNNAQQIQQPQQQHTSANKRPRKRAKLSSSSSANLSKNNKQQQATSYQQYQQTFENNSSAPAATMQQQNNGDESVWIYGLMNNIEQLLTTFSAINNGSTMNHHLPHSLSSSSSTSSPSSSASISALSSPASTTSSTPSHISTNNNNNQNTTINSHSQSPLNGSNFSNLTNNVLSTTSSSNLTSNAGLCQHKQQTGSFCQGVATNQLPRSPISRQIKFHEYKGPPSSKRQQQFATTNGSNSKQQQVKVATATNFSNTSAVAPANSNQQTKVGMNEGKHEQSTILNEANITTSMMSEQRQQQLKSNVGLEQQSYPSINYAISNMPISNVTAKTTAKTNVITTANKPLSQQQQALSVGNKPCSLSSCTSLKQQQQSQGLAANHFQDLNQSSSVRTQTHTTQQQARQVGSSIATSRLTSGPHFVQQRQASCINDSSFYENRLERHAPTFETHSDKPIVLLAPQFIEPKLELENHLQLHHRQQQQQQQQQTRNQVVPCSSLRGPSSSIEMGSVFMRSLDSIPPTISQQQSITGQGFSLSAPVRQRQQQQQQEQQQLVQQLEEIAQQEEEQQRVGGFELANFTDSNFQPKYAENCLDNQILTTVSDNFNPAISGDDSEEHSTDEIEPSISFSQGVDELLFSEFIDLQDVPMNVDESDWLKKFLPPCSMG